MNDSIEVGSGRLWQAGSLLSIPLLARMSLIRDYGGLVRLPTYLPKYLGALWKAPPLAVLRSDVGKRMHARNESRLFVMQCRSRVAGSFGQWLSSSRRVTVSRSGQQRLARAVWHAPTRDAQ